MLIHFTNVPVSKDGIWRHDVTLLKTIIFVSIACSDLTLLLTARQEALVKHAIGDITRFFTLKTTSSVQLNCLHQLSLIIKLLLQHQILQTLIHSQHFLVHVSLRKALEFFPQQYSMLKTFSIKSI